MLASVFCRRPSQPPPTSDEFDRFVLNGRIGNYAIAGIHVQVARALGPDAPFTLHLIGVGRLTGHVSWRDDERITVCFAANPAETVTLTRAS
jgi:hypothetical protein